MQRQITALTFQFRALPPLARIIQFFLYTPLNFHFNVIMFLNAARERETDKLGKGSWDLAQRTPLQTDKTIVTTLTQRLAGIERGVTLKG